MFCFSQRLLIISDTSSTKKLNNEHLFSEFLRSLQKNFHVFPPKQFRYRHKAK